MAVAPTETAVFKEDSRCKQCRATFGLMKRRHHCRVCGNSFCDTHSPKRVVIGSSKAMRMCDACHEEMTNRAARRANGGGTGTGPYVGGGDASESTAAKTSRRVAASSRRQASKVEEDAPPVRKVTGPPPWCTCGMPLCICDPPPEEAGPEPSDSTATAPPKPAPAPTPAPATSAAAASRAVRAASSSSSPFTPFGFVAKTYGTDVEGLRDAIKNGDLASVQRIIGERSELATEMDRSGQTMLHLAAMFNHTDIAQLLVNEGGADPSMKNCLGETVYEVSEEALKAWFAANS